MEIDRIELRGSANQLLGIIFWTPQLPRPDDRGRRPGSGRTGGYVLECHTSRCRTTSAHAYPTDAAAELLGHVTLGHPQPDVARADTAPVRQTYPADGAEGWKAFAGGPADGDAGGTA